MKRFLPLFDRVLVERLAAEVKTKGGVLLPEKSQGKVLEATVVAIGEGLRTDVSEYINVCNFGTYHLREDLWMMHIVEKWRFSEYQINNDAVEQWFLNFL